MTTEIKINGMACAHCKARVEKALAGVAGVENYEVSLEGKKATVTYNDSAVALPVIEEAIEAAGYDVVK